MTLSDFIRNSQPGVAGTKKGATGGRGSARAAADFRRLIDRALEAGGSYYLTYHRHAEKRQVEAAYPNFTRRLAEKETRDPRRVWNSDWFRHYRDVRLAACRRSPTDS